MMKLTVLGCSTPFPRPSEPCSGYLLSTSDSQVLLDCGSGVFASLLERMNPGDLSALWVSHMHPDHCADLVTLTNWFLNTPNAPKLRVIGPAGWASRLNSFIAGDSSGNLVASVFDIDYIEDGKTVEIDGLGLTSRRVHHSVDGYGVRISDGDSTFTYSGDTGMCDALEELANEADLFLCEAGSEAPVDFHLTIQQACDVGLRAAVGKLLITHVPHELPAGWQQMGSEVQMERVHVRSEWVVNS